MKKLYSAFWSPFSMRNQRNLGKIGENLSSPSFLLPLCSFACWCDITFFSEAGMYYVCCRYQGRYKYNPRKNRGDKSDQNKVVRSFILQRITSYILCIEQRMKCLTHNIAHWKISTKNLQPKVSQFIFSFGILNLLKVLRIFHFNFEFETTYLIFFYFFQN